MASEEGGSRLRGDTAAYGLAALAAFTATAIGDAAASHGEGRIVGATIILAIVVAVVVALPLGRRRSWALWLVLALAVASLVARAAAGHIAAVGDALAVVLAGIGIVRSRLSRP